MKFGYCSLIYISLLILTFYSENSYSGSRRFHEAQWLETIQNDFADATLIIATKRPLNIPYQQYDEYVGLVLECKQRDQDNTCLKALIHEYKQEIRKRIGLGPISYNHTKTIVISKKEITEFVERFDKNGQASKLIREHQKLEGGINFTHALQRHFSDWEDLPKYFAVVPFSIILDLATVPFQPFFFLAENARMKRKVEKSGIAVKNFLVSKKIGQPQYFRNYYFYFYFTDYYLLLPLEVLI